MHLILIKDSGKPTQLALPLWKIKALSVVVFVICLGLIGSGFMLKQSDFVDAAVIENWRAKLSEQDAVV